MKTPNGENEISVYLRSYSKRWVRWNLVHVAFVLAVGFALYTDHVEISRLQAKTDDHQVQINEFAQDEANNWFGLLNWAHNVRSVLEEHQDRITKLEQEKK